MIDWKRKLSSRKFWSLVIALVGSILVACNVPEGSIERITAIIGGGFAAIIVYILAEAHIDAEAVDKDS